MLFYNSFIKEDVVNAYKGIFTTIFFQGCPHECPNCFNKETWKMGHGYNFDENKQKEFINLAKRDVISGVSILGGEPFYQPRDEFFDFIRDLREGIGNDKMIIVWTGYEYEELDACIPKRDLLLFDIIIDGKYLDYMKILQPKDRLQKLKGSYNQRTIDVKKTIERDEICLFEED